MDGKKRETRRGREWSREDEALLLQLSSTPSALLSWADIAHRLNVSVLAAKKKLDHLRHRRPVVLPSESGRLSSQWSSRRVAAQATAVDQSHDSQPIRPFSMFPVQQVLPVHWGVALPMWGAVHSCVAVPMWGAAPSPISGTVVQPIACQSGDAIDAASAANTQDRRDLLDQQQVDEDSGVWDVRVVEHVDEDGGDFGENGDDAASDGRVVDHVDEDGGDLEGCEIDHDEDGGNSRLLYQLSCNWQELVVAAAAAPGPALQEAVRMFHHAVNINGLLVQGMFSSATLFALRCLQIDSSTCFQGSPYLNALRVNPNGKLAQKFSHLACMQAKAHYLHQQLLREAPEGEAVHLRSSHPFLTAPLWVRKAPRHVFMETLPKPSDYFAVFTASLRLRHSGGPSKEAMPAAVLAMVQPEEVNRARDQHEDEYQLLTVQDVTRILTTPVWSLMVRDLQAIAYLQSQDEYQDPEKGVALLVLTVLMANATNVDGMAEALGLTAGTRRSAGLSPRLCNWHAQWWCSSHGPMSRMRIPLADIGMVAWLDSYPVVFEVLNTDDMPKGMMEKGTVKYAGLLRSFFEFILDPEVQVRLDTSDEVQVSVNLYSTGCLNNLQLPWSMRQPSGRMFEYHPACGTRVVVTDYGKTELSHVRKDAAHRSDNYRQTRCLICMSLGFFGRQVTFSLSVVRGGSGTFQPPSDVVKSAQAYLTRLTQEQEAVRVLKLPDEEFKASTRDVYADLATEVRTGACDYVTVGMTVHRYFTQFSHNAVRVPGGPCARHIIPVASLPVKMRIDRCWPPTVFAPVVAELKRLRMLRSGRSFGDTLGIDAFGKHATQTQIGRYQATPPAPWTQTHIPLPRTADKMLEWKLYWAGLKVSKSVFESVKDNMEWSRSNHLLFPPATQAAVIMVLWVVSQTPFLCCALPPELVDGIVEHVVQALARPTPSARKCKRKG